jgi:hypothetical protein
MPTPLLYLPLKVPVRNDLVQPLAHWLDDPESQTGFDHMEDDDGAAPSAWVVPKPSYHSPDCRSELLRIAALRNCMSEHLQDSHKSALQNMMLRDAQDYHATLLQFEKQGFPTSFEDSMDKPSPIQLTWRGAFGIKGQETHSSLLWDRACTLWNVAALQSAQAAFDSDVKTKEGLKVAIGNLQSAASHLVLCQQLMETCSEHVDTVDLSKPMLQFWEKVCLAQAQVSIYKLANHPDSTVRNHTTLAYLIQGAAPLYNEALNFSKDPRLQSEVPQPSQEWAAHCKAQSMLCQARAYFHISISHRISKEAHGMEIARLQQTVQCLQELLQFCNSTQVLKEAVKLVAGKQKKGDDTISPMAAAAATIQPEAESLLKLAQDRLEQALQDNRTIYMDDVPRNLSELPEIRPQTMVKTDLRLSQDMLTPRAKLFEWVR